MNRNILVTKYTQAILDVALQEDKVDIIENQLKEFYNILNSNNQLYTILNHPVVSFGYKQKIIKEIGKNLTLELIVINFLKLLCRRKRINLFNQIIREFDAQLSEIRGKVKVVADTAFELGTLEIEKIKKNLEKLFKKDIVLEQKKNKNLIAGLSLRVDSLVYEFSIRAKLETLREELVRK